MSIAQRAGTTLSIACAAGALWLATRSWAPEVDPGNLAERGLVAWSQSCPGATTQGLCLAAPPPVPYVRGELPRRCGPEATALPAVRTRDVVEVDRALAAFEEHGDLPARARLARVDADLELRLFAKRIPMADELGDPWRERFATWWTATQLFAGELRERYQAIADGGDREVAVAAALRIGQIDRFLSDLLLASPIPESLRTGANADDMVETYCEGLVQAAEPIEQRAAAGFAACVRLASTGTELETDPRRLVGVLAWSEACSAQLVQLQPDKFPAVDEVFGPRTELAELHLRLRNLEAASRVLVAAPLDYDAVNAMGVTMRHRGDLVTAEYIYRWAIALDGARPEAYFNLGLAREAASLVKPPRDAIAFYIEAIALYAQSLARADGKLRAQAEVRIARAAKVIAAIDKFLVATREP